MSLLQIDLEGSSEEDFLKYTQQLATPSSGSQRVINYFPSGSINSHFYSLDDTDEEFELANTPKITQEEEGSAVLTYENFIEYEASTPKAPVYSMSNSVNCQEGSTTDRFYEEKSIKEEANILEIQNLNLKSENSQISEKFSNSKTKELEDEIQNWKTECERYEKQNQQLRSEIQLITNDFLEMELSLKQTKQDSQKFLEKQKTYDEEILRMYDIVEDISQEDGIPRTNRINKADGHIYNHIASKLEILRSRMHRYRAKNENLQNEIERLNLEIDENKDNELKDKIIDDLHNKLKISEELRIQKFDTEKDSMISELTERLENKDKIISQLENQVQLLKLGNDRSHSSRQSFTTDGSLTARQAGTFDSDTDQLTRRPDSSNQRAYEHFNYNDVLKDLREITSRASKALDQRNSIRNSYNVGKPNQHHSSSPFIMKSKEITIKNQPRRTREDATKKTSNYNKYQEYEELKRKYGGIANMSPIHRS
ncbi:unnamed protein product [Blepharisma stoltei]|uniref:Uncharacterized protein n=1 Tax=Blepharisma stoltei TaxID=1481888 RepID=A0AAU9JNU5_9CILI|nr:unnamed protein product [Blepharisma stoltei]